jgi:sarcosine oxidase subunit beta
MGKTIICRCEDVTVDEIRRAIAEGFDDIESIKRLLAVGTGPCQAKNCLAALTRLLIEEGKLDPKQAIPIVSRPPLAMTPLACFAGETFGEDE